MLLDTGIETLKVCGEAGQIVVFPARQGIAQGRYPLSTFMIEEVRAVRGDAKCAGDPGVGFPDAFDQATARQCRGLTW
ncbi:hypothetical protein OG225_13090 [Nocardia sp. NBC_01377]|uniref:hypothetical protein n=1 Tax=Nocardia sp. NBC_01377 TaxID=2903595 RepID=UPI003248D549